MRTYEQYQRVLGRRARAILAEAPQARAVLLEEALGRINPRDRRVLSAHLEGATLAEAGALVGVTPERARQMENRAIRRLRTFMAAPDEPYTPLVSRREKTS